MMKYTALILLFILTAIQSIADPTIYKIWVGENLEYLQINKKNAKFDHGSGFLENYKIKYKDSILTIFQYFWESGKLWRESEDYIFKISYLTNDTLILTPLNENASRVVENKKSYIFTDKNILYKPKLKFQKLYFASSGGCFGTCPPMEIEIDSAGTIYFSGERNRGNLNGIYKGRLSIYQLDSLIEILRISELDRFPKGLGCGYDQTDYGFKFYYDDKLKKCNGCHVPYFHNTLLKYLLSLYENIEFAKIEGIYEFDNEYIR